MNEFVLKKNQIFVLVALVVFAFTLAMFATSSVVWADDDASSKGMAANGFSVEMGEDGHIIITESDDLGFNRVERKNPEAIVASSVSYDSHDAHSTAPALLDLCIPLRDVLSYSLGGFAVLALIFTMIIALKVAQIDSEAMKKVGVTEFVENWDKKQE